MNSNMRTRLAQSPVALAVGLFLIALIVRLVLIWQTQFDGLYGQDTYAYVGFAAALKTALVQGQWPPAFFWPIGYPTLIAVLSLVMPVGSAAQLVSVLAGALLAALTFLITRDIIGDEPFATFSSVVAGLCVASAGQMLVSSVTAMSDAAGLGWATLSAFALTKFYARPTSRWLMLSAFALGWAVATRWVFTLLIPIWCTAVLLRPGFRSRLWPLLANAALALVSFVLAMSPQLALMSYHASRGSSAHVGDLQTVGWNLANAWQSDIVNSDGHFEYSLPVAAFYSLPMVHPSYLVLFFTPLMPLGVWALRRQKFFLVLILGWIGAVWGFLAGIAWENWRFPLAFFPPLAILVGVGLGALLRAPPILSLPRRNTIIVGLAATSLIFTLAWGIRAVDNFTAQQRANRAVLTRTNAHLSPDATLITFGLTMAFKYHTGLNVVEIFNETPASLYKIARERTNVFVLLDVDNIETQWAGREPQVNFHALRERFELRLTTRIEDYALFAVEGAR